MYTYTYIYIYWIVSIYIYTCRDIRNKTVCPHHIPTKHSFQPKKKSNHWSIMWFFARCHGKGNPTRRSNGAGGRTAG